MQRGRLIGLLVLALLPGRAEAQILDQALAAITADTFHVSPAQPLLSRRVPNKAERILLKVCLGVHTFGAGFDGATSARALRHPDYREANPAIGWFVNRGNRPARIWAVKASYWAGTTALFLWQAEAHPRLMALGACGSGALGIAAGVTNRRRLGDR